MVTLKDIDTMDGPAMIDELLAGISTHLTREQLERTYEKNLRSMLRIRRGHVARLAAQPDRSDPAPGLTAAIA